MDDLFKDLDPIAFPTPGAAGPPGEVIDVMEKIAGRPGGLRLLVDRYAHSEVPIVVRTLAFLLAQGADHATRDSRGLVYRAIERLRVRGDASTLMNLLTAVQRQAMGGAAWDGRMPDVLPGFFRLCWAANELVQSTAERAIEALSGSGAPVDSLVRKA